MSEAHCALAEQLACNMEMDQSVSLALSQMYERWDRRGAPKGLEHGEICTAARVLHVAHVLEVFERMHGRAAGRAELERRSGGHFEPVLTATVSNAEDEFAAILAAHLQALVGRLSKREQMVLRLRFGLDGRGTRTLQ